MMKEPQYLSCIEKSKENIFRQYLVALEEMGELSAEDEELKMSRLQRASRRGSPVFMWLSAEGLLRDSEDDIML